MREIYFDTETSGLDFEKNRIIELAMLVVEDGKIVREYDEFIDIGESLDPEITKLTGITDDMLSDEGINENTVAKDLRENLTPGTLMIAHNCQFDLSFVYYLLKRHYPNEADEILENVDWLDTLTVLKDRKEYPHKLIDAVQHYGIEEVNFHRAIDDTKALYEVYQALRSERDDLEKYENHFGYHYKYGINGIEFEFITYEEQSFNKRMVSPENILPKKSDSN